MRLCLGGPGRAVAIYIQLGVVRRIVIPFIVCYKPKKPTNGAKLETKSQNNNFWASTDENAQLSGHMGRPASYAPGSVLARI